MTNPDSIRRRERTSEAREARARAAEAREKELNHDRPAPDNNFHESLAAHAPAPATPIPNRTYRSEVDLTESHASTAEQIVRFIATLLDTLLVLRFVTSLFSADRSNGLVNALYALTDWLVKPFQALFGAPTGTGGFFDWPALTAIVVVSVLATLIIRFVRTPRV
jgi:uncharacterized protein YggT (Ycf19 family)